MNVVKNIADNYVVLGVLRAIWKASVTIILVTDGGLHAWREKWYEGNFVNPVAFFSKQFDIVRVHFLSSDHKDVEDIGKKEQKDTNYDPEHN